MATVLVTSQRERRNGLAVSAANANAASGAGAKDRTGEACSEGASAKGDPRQSSREWNKRADESCAGCDTGVPVPANRLAASADKLKIIRAVK